MFTNGPIIVCTRLTINSIVAVPVICSCLIPSFRQIIFRQITQVHSRHFRLASTTTMAQTMRAVGKYPSLNRVSTLFSNSLDSRYQKRNRARNLPLHQPLHPKTKPQTHRRHCENKMLRPQPHGPAPTRRALPSSTSGA